jgi:hypothetical protein
MLMNRQSTTTFDDAGGSGLDGQWKEILRAGTIGSDQSGGETYTPADLDGMVKEYKLRGYGDRAPIALGLPGKTDPEPLGQIDGLRRVGDSLQAKFSGIDPRVEHLYGRGAFPKKSVQIKRSLEGDSLQRVGLIHPTYSGSAWHDDGTPSLDELEKQHMGSKDHVFTSRGGYVEVEMPFAKSDLRAGSAAAVVALLKERGYWSDRFDHFKFPWLFAELQGTPAFDLLTKYLIELQVKADPTSLLLSERAQYFARRNGLNFGEALNQVSQMSWDAPASTAAQTITPELRQAEKESSDRAITSGALSPELAAMAWQTARSENVTFKQALCRAAAEHPEIVASWVADGLYRQEHPLGSGR